MVFLKQFHAFFISGSFRHIYPDDFTLTMTYHNQVISILFYNASLIRKIDMKESLLVGWCESHISMKCERYMTFTPRHQQIFIEIQYFRYFFKQCGPAVTLTSKG